MGRSHLKGDLFKRCRGSSTQAPHTSGGPRGADSTGRQERAGASVLARSTGVLTGRVSVLQDEKVLEMLPFLKYNIASTV